MRKHGGPTGKPAVFSTFPTEDNLSFRNSRLRRFITHDKLSSMGPISYKKSKSKRKGA